MNNLIRVNDESTIQTRLVSIVESSDDAIMTKTLNGIITSWNSSAERIFGYSAEEVIGQPMAILIPPDREDEEARILALIGRGEKVHHFETVRVKKGGEKIYVSATISPLKDSKGNIIGASKIARDITHTRRIETNAKSAIYLEAVGKLALVSITDRRGNIIHANPKFCEVSGYTSEHLIGRTHRILNSGFHPKAFWVEMWAMVSKGESWHQEVCNRNKNGDLYWVDSIIVPLKDDLGKVDGYLSVRVDITKIKGQKAALRERLKESICLYEIRRSMLPKSSIGQICQVILAELTKAMQFPEAVAIRIELNDEEYTSANYSDDLVHGLYSDIKLDSNSYCGKLQVFYLENLPFIIPEEQVLIKSIAEDLGKWCERIQAEQRIDYLATHDVLTGLPNRHLLLDRLAQALARQRRSDERAAVLFIDLDYFKVINDSLGHDIGDQLLKEIADRLLVCVSGEDTVARQGGDEFIIVLQIVIDTLDAGTVAQKILDSLSQPYYIRGEVLHISVSAGIALYPDDGKNVDMLLRNSDFAMYHAKENGRNQYQYYLPKMNQLAMERYILGTDLRRALDRNEFRLQFQPLIGMPDGKIKGVEALLRWQHPELGLVPPLKFISLAEEIGLIVPIGEWVLRTVCLQIKAWLEEGYEVPDVAINLSFRQFRHKSLVSDISSILDETAVAASYLTIEITESMLAQNVDEATSVLGKLSAMGMKIAMDDFGTGYSSLSYLKRFPINTLKIDRSFVRDITSDPDDAAIITAIIAMAKSLKLGVVAEGVETEEQVDFLVEKGCDRFQGFYFSKPLSVSKITSKLQPVTV